VPSMYPLLDRVRTSMSPVGKNRLQLPLYFNISPNRTGFLDIFLRVKHREEAGSPVKNLFIRLSIDSGFIIARLNADRDLLIGYAAILIIFSLFLGSKFARNI